MQTDPQPVQTIAPANDLRARVERALDARRHDMAFTLDELVDEVSTELRANPAEVVALLQLIAHERGDS